MSFQLVRASETDIVVWHVEHGHIFMFQVCPEGSGLRPVVARDAPDASEPASGFAEAALRFATGEAESRQLLQPLASQSVRRCGTAMVD